MDLTLVAAYLATTLLFSLTVFQVALIAGAPIGKFAWGGQYRVLPRKLRIASTISLFIYAFFALLALDGAGLINLFANDAFVSVALWVSFAYFTFGIFLNAISRSRPERFLMTPIAAVLAVCYLLIAL